MTSVDVNDVLKRTQSTANGSTTDFSFSFQVNATNEIKVYEDSTLKTEGTHYDIVDSSASAGLNANGTGVVKFKTSPTDYTPANNKVITILSVMSLARASVYSSGGNITAASLETDFDRLHRIAGDFKEVKSRTVIAPEYSATNVDMTLPAKATRAGKLLGFNSSTGNPEATFTVADGTTLASISADIATLADIEDGTDATDAIQTVAGIHANVTTVAGIHSDVTTVADNISTISAKAPLASPALTGNPTAPTQSASDNSTKIATTAYVDNQVATENTIAEMDDVTITSIGDNEILQYNNSTSKFENQTLAEAGILTGNQTITLSGDVSGSGTTSIAVTIADDSHNHTIANVDNLQTSLDAKAPLASPSLTGTPVAPTASGGTNTTQIATTAFVTSATSNKATKGFATAMAIAL